MDYPILCNKTWLKIDQACLKLQYLPLDFTSPELQIFSQSAECEDCPLEFNANIIESEVKHFIFPTKYSTLLQLQTAAGKKICSFDYLFEEFGIYSLNFTHDSCTDIVTVAESANIYLPFIIVLTILLAGFLSLKLIWFAYTNKIFSRYFLRRQAESQLFINDLGSPPRTTGMEPQFRMSPSNQLKNDRLKSLDAFRGLCIMVMIFVNYGGGGYVLFSHSPWNGLTIADLVFPWFMSIMGVSIVLSIKSQLRKAIPRKYIMLKIIKRSVILFSLGIIINSIKQPNINELRIPGVLQRFAFAYILSASLEAMFSKPGDPHSTKWWRSLRDLVYGWHQLMLFCVCSTTALCITFLLTVPGCPSGYLGPGGFHKNSSFYNCTGGSFRYLDGLIFGPQHLIKHSLSQTIYKSPFPNDPEGLLGSIYSVLTVILGTYIGRTLTVFKSNKNRLLRWSMLGLLTGCIAASLTFGTKNSGVIPINKNLWSLSFVMTTSFLGTFTFMILYLLIDKHHVWSGTPFIYPGMNSIALYIGHEFTRKVFPWGWESPVSSHIWHLSINLWGALLWMLISIKMYNHDWFLTL